jgi:hypothetical protein
MRGAPRVSGADLGLETKMEGRPGLCKRVFTNILMQERDTDRSGCKLITKVPL